MCIDKIHTHQIIIYKIFLNILVQIFDFLKYVL